MCVSLKGGEERTYPECVITKIERQRVKTKPDGRSYEIMYLSFKKIDVYFLRRNEARKYIEERTERTVVASLCSTGLTPFSS